MSKQPASGKRAQDNTSANDRFDAEDGDDASLAPGPLEAAARALRDSMEFAGAMARLRLRRMSELPESMLEATRSASSDVVETLMLRIGEGGVLLGEQVSRAGAAISTSALRLVTEATDGVDEAEASPARARKGGTQVVMAPARTASERARSRPTRRSPTAAPAGVQRVGVTGQTQEQAPPRRRRAAGADLPAASDRTATSATKSKSAPALSAAARTRSSTTSKATAPRSSSPAATTAPGSPSTTERPAPTTVSTQPGDHTADTTASPSASSPAASTAAMPARSSGIEATTPTTTAPQQHPVHPSPVEEVSGSGEGARQQGGDR